MQQNQADGKEAERKKSMTENEAIKKLNMLDEALNFQRADADESSCALQMAIQALEEIRQYRAIGTVEEFKALKEKTEQKKVVYQIDGNGHKHEKCPACGSFHVFGKHCTECGQALET